MECVPKACEQCAHLRTTEMIPDPRLRSKNRPLRIGGYTNELNRLHERSIRLINVLSSLEPIYGDTINAGSMRLHALLVTSGSIWPFLLIPEKEINLRSSL